MFKKFIAEVLLPHSVDLSRLKFLKRGGAVAILTTRLHPFLITTAALFIFPLLYAIWSGIGDPFWGTWVTIGLFGPPAFLFALCLCFYRTVFVVDRTLRKVKRTDRILFWSKETVGTFDETDAVSLVFAYGNDCGDLEFHVVIPGLPFFKLAVAFDLKRARETANFLKEATGLPLEDQVVGVESDLVSKFGSRILGSSRSDVGSGALK